MRVAFYLSEGKSTTAYVLADMMVRGVRKVMPGCEIVQLTDAKSSALYGLDGLIRKDGDNTMRLRLEHYADLDGDHLLLDSDAYVQADVSHVFDSEFDVAVADRIGSMLPAEVDSPFMKAMPYNLGVVFSRNPAFWKAALAEFDAFPDAYKKEIVSDQMAVNNVIRSGAFKVRILPGVPYNVSPMTEEQDVSGASILHYKGRRKYWMLKRLYRELGLPL